MNSWDPCSHGVFSDMPVVKGVVKRLYLHAMCTQCKDFVLLELPGPCFRAFFFPTQYESTKANRVFKGLRCSTVCCENASFSHIIVVWSW